MSEAQDGVLGQTVMKKAELRPSSNARAPGEADHAGTICYEGTTGIHNTLGAERRQ